MKYFFLLMGVIFTILNEDSVAGFERNNENQRHSLIPFYSESSLSVLSSEEAFGFSYYIHGDALVLLWDIRPGYFIYRDKLEFILDGDQIYPTLPQGRPWDDEVFGQVSVLDGKVEIRLMAVTPSLEYAIGYQGCASTGYCYPPEKVVLNFPSITD